MNSRPPAKPLLPLGEERNRLIYDIMVRAADNNENCPHDLELGQALGFKSPTAGRRAMNELAAEGRITYPRAGGGRPRVVTIVATGKTTRSEPTKAIVAIVALPKILRLKARGHTAPEIGKMVGLSANHVNKILRRNGRGRKLKPEPIVPAAARTWCDQCERLVLNAIGVGCGFAICGLRQSGEQRPQQFSHGPAHDLVPA